MLASSETTCSDLEMVYGSQVKAVPELKCFPNAFHALFHIYMKSNGAVLPRVWRIDLKEMHDNHAYLQVGKDVYNRGITWPDGKYPDFNLAQLREQGVDHTTTVITQALMEWEGRDSGPELGFKKAIELLGYTDRELVSKTLNTMIGKSFREEEKV